MAKKGGGQTQTTENTPWAPQGAALSNVFSQAKDVFNQGGFGAVADQSPYTQQAIEQQAQRALGGGFGATDAAGDLTRRTIEGQFMDPNSNPYAQAAFQYGQQPVIDQFNEQVAPNIDAAFARAGGLNSGAYANTRNRAEDTLARNLAGAGAQFGANVYDRERGRQQQAVSQAPGIESAGYGNIGRLGAAGGAIDAYQQALASQDARNLRGYAGTVQGGPGYGTQTTTTDRGNGNPFMQIAGLGLAGAGAASGLGWAPFAAQAMGAAGGGVDPRAYGFFGGGPGSMY